MRHSDTLPITTEMICQTVLDSAELCGKCVSFEEAEKQLNNDADRGCLLHSDCRSCRLFHDCPL